MHDGKGIHIIQSLNDLNGKALGKGHGKALEVIVLDELIQVNAQHFERDAHVASEREAVFDAHNVFGVVAVIVSKSF